MATTSIIVNATNTAGKSVQKAMTCVNPDATNAQLAELGQMITAVSNHTYSETYRIDKTNCDLESGKTTPTLSASKTTYSLAEFTATGNIFYLGGASTLTYNGDGDLVVEPDTGISIMVSSSNGNVVIEPYYVQGHAPTVPLTFTVGFTETANYKACSVEITVNA